ncbi:VacB/RNase II family 3'-5' exoribonuclease [Campylobacter sp. FMV-PI01]|uniref:VacB/RNase II family 3'-5' exoribonuclease n=1 Tax=Campylobacter portucalensis TaxID=2608384 RepID=A0A6L5WLP0_9BACT|nr:ribonuclease R family protein [Campylobacter portucalensis]MSN96723.1 VacB/RNase II family 3'-5' exoribonuclease [Campylobacter portucalensis]
MRKFLENLLQGVHQSTLKSSQKEILRNLEMMKAVSLYKKIYYLNDGFICGKLDINLKGVGFIEVFDPKFIRDVIVENRDIKAAKQGDIVLAKLIKSKKTRLKAKILMNLKPAFATSVVYTKKIGKTIMGVNLKSGLAINLKATQKSLKSLLDGTLLKIDNKTDEIIEVLGNINDDFMDEKISLALYNKNDEFSEICEQEALSFGNFVDKNMYENRVDLTNFNFCTIDPVDAKDFDDAIYFDEKSNTLYVAIADVSEYVQPYCAIDKEAKFRGFSIYFPHKSVPMLPRNLSENICSLKPNLDRLAFCFKITLDKNYNVIKEELLSAVINSKKRFNYDEVDEILKIKKYNDKNMLKMLLNLDKLAQNLKSLRLKNGFDFQNSELKLTLDDKNKISSTRFETQSPSHSLIEECMLLANKAAAKCIDRGIFRNHDTADDKKMQNLKDDLLALNIDVKFDKNLVNYVSNIQNLADKMGIRQEVDKLIIKAQKRAVYEEKSRGHFGLGFDTYTHFTSPIRRYSDLLLHRLLKAKLNSDEKLFNYLLLNIQDLCDELNILEREADKVSYDFMDRKFARWAKDKIGQNFRCYINENENIVTAKLNDKFKGARIFILNYTNDILTPVLVQIYDVDIASAKIFGKVVKKLDV